MITLSIRPAEVKKEFDLGRITYKTAFYWLVDIIGLSKQEANQILLGGSPK